MGHTQDIFTLIDELFCEYDPDRSAIYDSRPTTTQRARDWEEVTMATKEERIDNVKAGKTDLDNGELHGWIKLDVPGIRFKIDGNPVNPTVQAALKRALNANSDVVAGWLYDELRNTVADIVLD